MIYSQNLLSRLTIGMIFIFNPSIYLAYASRIPLGPTSELTGSGASIENIVSHGSSRNKAPLSELSPTQNTNSTAVIKLNKDPKTHHYYDPTCSISFEKRSNIRPPQSPIDRISRRALDLSRDDERSALFMTEAAEKCVESSRAWGATRGFPLGVGVCYSLGYLDGPKSTVGGQINVFRLGTVSELSRMRDMDVNEVKDSARLQLSFLSQNSPDVIAEYSKSSVQGALRLSQPPLAPSDDSTHLINPSNPQFTASYGETEMVLIGSFHWNLQDTYVPKASRIRKRDDVERLSVLTPSGARLMNQEQPILQTHFFDLSDHPTKRSRLAGTKSWGLFKRQAVSSISSNSEFSSDSACPDASLSSNSIFSGDGKDPPVSIEDRRRLFESEPTTPPIIPPSSFLSPAARDVNSSFRAPSKFVTQSSFVGLGGKNVSMNAYELPGRYMVVLPVGLIIYGALCAMCLLMVIIGTYERKQYRDQFRKRKNEQRGLPSDHFGNFSVGRV